MHNLKKIMHEENRKEIISQHSGSFLGDKDLSFTSHKL